MEYLYKKIYKLLQRFWRFLWRLRWKYFPLKNPYVDTAYNPIHAYRCYDGRVEEIKPVDMEASCELSNKLIQEPGYIHIRGYVYDMRADGVYRIYRLGDFSEQRIVCKSGIGSFLKMCGYLWSYGTKDNHLIETDLYRELTKRTVSCACRQLSELVIFIGKKFDFNLRLAAGLTKSPWNGYDDGHTLTEVYWNGLWVAYDPSFNKVFKSQDKYLNILELSQIDFSLLSLETLPGNFMPRTYQSANYNYGFWVDSRFLSEEILVEWYKRLFQIPLIYYQGRFYFPENMVDEYDKSRIKWQYFGMPESEFLRRFYGEE